MAQYERVSIGKVKRPLPEMPGLFGITKAESNDDLALIKASHEELLAGNNVASRSGVMKRRKKSAGASSEAEPIDEDEKTSKRLRLASKVGRERKNLATQKTSHQNMRRHLEAVRLEINHYRDAIAQARREIQSATADRDILEDDYNSLRAQLQRDVNIARQNQQDYKNSILEFHERYNHEFSQEKDFGKLLEDLRRLESDIRNRDVRLHELTQELRKAHMERELITDALRRHTGFSGTGASAAAASATTSPTITGISASKPASSPGPAAGSAASSSSSSTPASGTAPGGTVLSVMKAHNASITSPTAGAASPPPAGAIGSPLAVPASASSDASASAPATTSQDVAMEPVKTEESAPVTASVVTAESAAASSSSDSPSQPTLDLPSELVLIRKYVAAVENAEQRLHEMTIKNRDLESQVHSRDRTIEDLRKQLDEASKGTTEAASTTKSAESRLKELNEQQELLRKENETLKKELDTYKADVQQYEEKARMHQEIVDAADQRASEAAAGVVELITQLKVLKAGADTLHSYNLRMRTELQTSEEQLNNARNELKEHKNATRKLNKEVSRLRGEADQARVRVASLYQQNKELQDRLGRPNPKVQEMLATVEKQIHQQQIAAAAQIVKQLTALPASAFDEHELASLQSDPSLLAPPIAGSSSAVGAAAQ